MKKRKRSKARNKVKLLARATPKRSNRRTRGLTPKQIQRLIPDRLPNRIYTPEETAERQALFLAALARTGLENKSAKAAGVSTSLVHKTWLCEGTLREWTDAELDAAETFRELMHEAQEAAADLLEQEARRRGMKGIDKPVWYKGRIVGHMKEYSDRLLERLLEAHRARFRSKSEVKVDGLTPPTTQITRIERVVVKPNSQE